MARAPFLPFLTLAVNDHLAETAPLTLAERGLYVHALCVSWRIGPLPLDPASLAKALAVPPTALRKTWPGVSALFEKRQEGYVSSRLEAEYLRAAAAKERKSYGASKTNAKRYAKRSPSDPLSGSPLSPSLSVSSSLSNAPPSPSCFKSYSSHTPSLPARSADEELLEKIRRLIEVDPSATDEDIAGCLGVLESRVRAIRNSLPQDHNSVEGAHNVT